MITLSIVFLVFSFIYLFIVFSKMNINIASNYSVYILFSALYSVFPILTYFNIEPQWFAHLSLNDDELLLSTQIFIMAFCNCIYAFVFHQKYKVTPNQSASTIRPKFFKYQNFIFVIYMLFSCLVIYQGYKYNYTSGRSVEISAALSGQKVRLAGIYVFFLVTYGFNFRTKIMFLSYVILLLVEQSRWYFFSVLIVTLFYIQNNGKISGKQVVVVSTVFFVILSYIGLYRVGFEVSNISMLWLPFFIEGDFGSYMILQTYDIIFNSNISFVTLFSDYIVDPIIYFIPFSFFELFNITNDSYRIFQNFISEHQPYLQEKYAPAGGFNYIAQASSAIPFFGPLLVTYVLARVTVVIEINKYKSKFRELTYYLYSSGFFFVFIKTMFDMTIRYYLTLAIPAYILYFILMRLKGHSNEKNMLS